MENTQNYDELIRQLKQLTAVQKEIARQLHWMNYNNRIHADYGSYPPGLGFDRD